MADPRMLNALMTNRTGFDQPPQQEPYGWGDIPGSIGSGILGMFQLPPEQQATLDTVNEQRATLAEQGRYKEAAQAPFTRENMDIWGPEMLGAGVIKRVGGKMAAALGGGITRKGGAIATPEDTASIMDTNRWFDYGPKLKKGANVYRGVSDTSGSHSAQYGRGLYTTTDKAQAKEFGDVLKMSPSDIPSNPLRFSDEMAYRNWEQNARGTLGYNRASEFDTAHGSPEEWIRKIDPNVDGIQIGDGGKGTYFVKWSSE